jgi:hypothetical protein
MTLEELTAIENIKQLKGRYCRFIDSKDWDGYRAVFATDSVLNVDTAVSTLGRDPKPQPEVRGGDNIRNFVAELLVDASTVHQCHTPEITLTSPTTASGIWAMEDVVEMRGFHLHAFGHYRETYVIENGEWRIATLHLTRTRIEMIDGDAQGPKGKGG